MNNYFTYQELIKSSTADKKGINNIPNKEEEENIYKLINNVLNPVREMWGSPIIVNSGFRSIELNKSVGGASNSQHLTGNAADITTGTKEGNKRLFDMIVNSNIEFDQLIDENNFSWIHISFNQCKNRKQVLHLK